MIRNLILLLVLIYVLSKIYGEYLERKSKRRKREGDIHVSGNPNKPDTRSDQIGEYVEYEEIKDEKK